MSESPTDFTCIEKTSANFQFELTNVLRLDRRLYSKFVVVRGVSWRCLIAPQITNGFKYLGIAAECCGGTEYVTFLADVTMRATLRRSNAETGEMEVIQTQNCDHTFTNRSVAGLMEFVDLNQLRVPQWDAASSSGKPVTIDVELDVHELRNVCMRSVSYFGCAPQALSSEINRGGDDELLGGAGGLNETSDVEMSGPVTKKRKIFAGLPAEPMRNNVPPPLPPPTRSFFTSIFRRLVPAATNNETPSNEGTPKPFTCLPSVYEGDLGTLVLKDQSTQTMGTYNYSPEEFSSRFVSADDFLKALECPVCRGMLQPPIRLCRKGHSICGSCEPLLREECPVCRREMREYMRNFALETVVENIKFACDSDGCSAFFIAGHKNNHLLECTFRDVKCCACNNWHRPFGGYASHIESCAAANVLRTAGDGYTEYRVPLKLTDGRATSEAAIHTQFVLFDDRVFCLTFYIVNNIYVGIKMFGTAAEARRYSLELQLESLNAMRAWLYNIRPRHLTAPVRCDLEVSFSNSRTIVIDTDSVVDIGTNKGVVDQGLVGNMDGSEGGVSGAYLGLKFRICE